MIFVANYKMNGDKKFYKKVNRIFNKLKFKDTVVLCPPFVYMPFFKIRNKNVFLGSQDVSVLADKKGTGQISPNMLHDFDVKYCIVGHSERRFFGETDELISQKVDTAQNGNLIPIICVGEIEKNADLSVLEQQVEKSLKNAKQGEIIFAYEPVWAIGTGENATVTQVNRATKIIRQTAKKLGFEVKVLYGGSVNENNHTSLKKAKIDGFLMGGVSLKIKEFINIVKE